MALSRHSGSHRQVLVAQREIASGTTLQNSDITALLLPNNAVPPNAYLATDEEQLVGARVISRMQAGEIFSSTRVLGDEGIRDFGFDQATTLVPISLSDPTVVALLKHGDTVDVLQHQSEEYPDALVASDARVVYAAEETESRSAIHGAPLLLALPEDAARQVATAAMQGPLTVVITA